MANLIIQNQNGIYTIMPADNTARYRHLQRQLEKAKQQGGSRLDHLLLRHKLKS